MKTRELPKGAIIHGVLIDDKETLLTFHKMDGMYGLFTMPDGTTINFNAEFEERDGEYFIL